MLMTKNKRLRQIAGLLESGNWLFLKLLMKNPARAHTYPGRVYRDYLGYVGGDGIQCKPIFDLLPTDENLRFTLEHIPSPGLDMRLEQIACLALLTKAIQPEVVFEIGTFRGRTALNFALNSPEDCVVYTMDLPTEGREESMEQTNRADARIIEESLTGCEYRGTDMAPKIVQVLADSTTFDFSPHYGKIDMVYIDGAHHYEAVLSDTENALEMVKPGGYILWDEFVNYGDYHDVTRAVFDLLPRDQVSLVESTELGVYRKPVST